MTRRGNRIRTFHREVPEQQVRGSPCQSASQRAPSSPRAREAVEEEHPFNHRMGFPRKPLSSKSDQGLEQNGRGPRIPNGLKIDHTGKDERMDAIYCEEGEA